MVAKLIALYKNPANKPEFDEKYFQEHLPLARKMPGLQLVEVSRITGAPMGEAKYHIMAELYFEDVDSMKSALASPEGKAAGKNLMGFAGELVSMMFAEVDDRSNGDS